jgi:hypothetical protein
MRLPSPGRLQKSNAAQATLLSRVVAAEMERPPWVCRRCRQGYSGSGEASGALQRGRKDQGTSAVVVSASP